MTQYAGHHASRGGVDEERKVEEGEEYRPA